MAMIIFRAVWIIITLIDVAYYWKYPLILLVTITSFVQLFLRAYGKSVNMIGIIMQEILAFYVTNMLLMAFVKDLKFGVFIVFFITRAIFHLVSIYYVENYLHIEIEEEVEV